MKAEILELTQSAKRRAASEPMGDAESSAIHDLARAIELLLSETIGAFSGPPRFPLKVDEWEFYAGLDDTPPEGDGWWGLGIERKETRHGEPYVAITWARRKVKP